MSAGIYASAYVAPAGGGGFTPTDLASLILWLPIMSDGTSVTVSGTDVTALADSSGNSNDYSDSTGGTAYAQYGSRTINSINVLDVSGLDQMTADVAWSPRATDGPLTVCAVVDIDNTDANRSLFGETGTTTVGQGGAGTGKWRIRGGSNVQWVGPPSGTPQVITWIADGASSIVREDGVASSDGVQDIGTFTIGTSHTLFNGAAQSIDGGVGEIVVCDTALSGTDLTDLESYMATLAGL